jgi:hypothetical protein
MGTWRLFTPNNSPSDIAYMNEKTYVAFENGLFEYDVESGEKFLWTAANYLSDVGLTSLCHAPVNNTLLIGYANGNLDLITNNVIYNLPALVLANVLGDKRINKMTYHEEFVYVSTGIGIMKINPVRREVADTYFPFPSSTAIWDVAFHGDTIFALSSNGIRFANKNNIALADFTQWQDYANTPTQTAGSYRNLVLFNDQLWLRYKSPITSYATDTLYRRVNNAFEVVPNFLNLEIHNIRTQNGNLFLSADAQLAEYTPDLQLVELIYQYDEGSAIAPNGAYKLGLDFYIADLTFGLVKARNAFSHQKLGFEAPYRNSFFALDNKEGFLLVAGGGLSGFNQSFNTSGVYMFRDEKWSYINNTNAPAMSQNTWDVISVSIDPNDLNHFAFGSYSGRPLFEVKDGETIDAFYDANNSPLELTTLGNNAYNVSQLFFDNSSNLWIAQSYSNFPLKVKTKDGVFVQYDLGPDPKAKVINDLRVDFNDYKWLATQGGGLVVFNDNGTPLDTSDDQFKVLKEGTGIGNLPSTVVTSVCVDFNNDIWIGTDKGLVVYYNSSRIFNSNSIDAQPILIEFEEEIERLLGSTAITKIVIDGGNRKWIATESAGVILFSTDGRQEIYNFNTSNSPLMSNAIRDIAINEITGEVFFVTEKGLQSFRSDASASDFEYSNVQVFPNPFRPDFNGVVTIQGIAYESEVRVTDAAGNLVYKTVSNGGTAIWNGELMNGERAASGVYLIWTAPINAKGRYVGKFVLIN